MPETVSSTSILTSLNSVDMPHTVIFDLDGTLVDVVPLMVRILNQLAPEFGYTPLMPNEVAAAKKLDLKALLFRKLGLRFWRYAEFHRRGRALYHEELQQVHWFPGMQTLYRTLQAHGFRVGVISTNAERTIIELLKQNNLRADFIASTTFFGKAKAIRQTMEQYHCASEDMVYVGDELRDIAACRKARVPIIAVTWGLNDRQVLIDTGVPTADTVEELTALLLNGSPKPSLAPLASSWL